MPVQISEIVRAVDIGPIETGDEPVELRVEILHHQGADRPYSARVWRHAVIQLHPLREEEDEVQEFRILIEDETIGSEEFAGDSADAVLDQILHRIRAAWYIPR